MEESYREERGERSNQEREEARGKGKGVMRDE